MTQSTEQERAAFESDWMKSTNTTTHPKRSSNGDYVYPGAYNAWKWWQAARRAPVGAVPQDPMDWPLPCDVTVGNGTMRKGVKLRTLVLRMQALYKMATGNDANEVAARTTGERRELLNSFVAKIAAAPQPPES